MNLGPLSRKIFHFIPVNGSESEFFLRKSVSLSKESNVLQTAAGAAFGLTRFFLVRVSFRKLGKDSLTRLGLGIMSGSSGISCKSDGASLLSQQFGGACIERKRLFFHAFPCALPPNQRHTLMTRTK